MIIIINIKKKSLKIHFNFQQCTYIFEKLSQKLLLDVPVHLVSILTFFTYVLELIAQNFCYYYLRTNFFYKTVFFRYTLMIKFINKQITF